MAFATVFLTMVIGMAVVSTMTAMRLVEFFGFLEIVALAGKSKHTERQRDQEKFHHAPSITTRQTNATPKDQKEL
jgi:hypothetical protein